MNLAVNGEVPEPQSELGEHINFCWGDLNGPSERSLVHWIRRLVFRGAWLDQRVMEGELEVVFDEHDPLLRLRPARPQLRADRALARAELARGRVSALGFLQPRCNILRRRECASCWRPPWPSRLVGLVAAPAAGAKERLLTLYSPKIDSLPVRARHAPGDARGRRRGRSQAARLHPRLQGDGAGRLQEPEGQAAADREDDGPPLPLLRPRPRGPGRRAAAGAAPASSAAAARSTRSATRS